jgi:hypothetical protein
MNTLLLAGIVAGCVLGGAGSTLAAEPEAFDASRWITFDTNYRYVSDHFKGCGISPAARTAFAEHERELAQALQHTPGLPGPGIIGWMSGSWEPCLNGNDRRAGSGTGEAMRGSLSFFPFLEQEVERLPNGAARRTGETTPVKVLINTIPPPNARDRLFPVELEIGPVVQVDQIGGYPVLTTGDGRSLVLAAPAHPSLYSPVSLREALKAFLDSDFLEYERSDNNRSACGAAAKAHAASARQLLQTLSPTELDGPAFEMTVRPPTNDQCAAAAGTSILATAVPGSTPLLRPNASYFNHSLPISEIQLLVVNLDDWDPKIAPDPKRDGKYSVVPESRRRFALNTEWAALVAKFVR